MVSIIARTVQCRRGSRPSPTWAIGIPTRRRRRRPTTFGLCFRRHDTYCSANLLTSVAPVGPVRGSATAAIINIIIIIIIIINCSKRDPRPRRHRLPWPPHSVEIAHGDVLGRFQQPPYAIEGLLVRVGPFRSPNRHDALLVVGIRNDADSVVLAGFPPPRG